MCTAVQRGLRGYVCLAVSDLLLQVEEEKERLERLRMLIHCCVHDDAAGVERCCQDPRTRNFVNQLNEKGVAVGAFLLAALCSLSVLPRSQRFCFAFTLLDFCVVCFFSQKISRLMSDVQDSHVIFVFQDSFVALVFPNLISGWFLMVSRVSFLLCCIGMITLLSVLFFPRVTWDCCEHISSPETG